MDGERSFGKIGVIGKNDTGDYPSQAQKNSLEDFACIMHDLTNENERACGVLKKNALLWEKVSTQLTDEPFRFFEKM